MSKMKMTNLEFNYDGQITGGSANIGYTTLTFSISCDEIVLNTISHPISKRELVEVMGHIDGKIIQWYNTREHREILGEQNETIQDSE